MNHHHKGYTMRTKISDQSAKDIRWEYSITKKGEVIRTITDFIYRHKAVKHAKEYIDELEQRI